MANKKFSFDNSSALSAFYIALFKGFFDARIKIWMGASIVFYKFSCFPFLEGKAGKFVSNMEIPIHIFILSVWKSFEESSISELKGLNCYPCIKGAVTKSKLFDFVTAPYSALFKNQPFSPLLAAVFFVKAPEIQCLQFHSDIYLS